MMSWVCEACMESNIISDSACALCAHVRRQGDEPNNEALRNCDTPSLLDLIQPNYSHQESSLNDYNIHNSALENITDAEQCKVHELESIESQDEMNPFLETDQDSQDDDKIFCNKEHNVTAENFEFVSIENSIPEADGEQHEHFKTTEFEETFDIKEEPLDWDESFETPEEQSSSLEFVAVKEENPDSLDQTDTCVNMYRTSSPDVQPPTCSTDQRTTTQCSENMSEISSYCDSEYNFETQNIKTESVIVNCDIYDVLLNSHIENDHDYAMQMETETSEGNEVADNKSVENINSKTNSNASTLLSYNEANALVLKYYFEHLHATESIATTAGNQSDCSNASVNVQSPVGQPKDMSNYIMKTLCALRSRMQRMSNLNRGFDGCIYCESCDRDFPFFEFLKSHIELFEEQRSCKCALCGKTVSNMTFVTFLKHMYMHLVLRYPKVKRCTSCSSVFCSKYNYNIHVKRRHPLSISVPSSPHMSLNMTVETENQATIQDCDVNPTQFNSLVAELKSLMNNLVLPATKQLVVHCPSCSLDIPAASYLHSHFALCLNEGLYRCPFCLSHRPQPDLTKFVCEMLKHLRCKWNFECKECDKWFINASNHYLHSQISHCQKVGDKVMHLYLSPFKVSGKK